MKIVVDTNILFSALLATESRQSEALFLLEHEWVIPTFAFVDLFKYKEKILKYSKMEEHEVLQMLHLLIKRIRFSDTEKLPPEFRKKAIELCGDIDPKDSPFIALTLFENAKFWNSDQKLIKGLQARGFEDFWFDQDLR